MPIRICGQGGSGNSCNAALIFDVLLRSCRPRGCTVRAFPLRTHPHTAPSRVAYTRVTLLRHTIDRLYIYVRGTRLLLQRLPHSGVIKSLSDSSRPTTQFYSTRCVQDMGSANSTPNKPTITTSEKRAAMTNKAAERPDAAAAADMLAQLHLRTSTTRPSASITMDSLKSWEGDFVASPKHRLASTVLSKSAFADVLVRREAQLEAQQVFNVKLSTEGKPITNQKSSGRCWLFSATKCVTEPFPREEDSPPADRVDLQLLAHHARPQTGPGRVPVQSELPLFL